MGLILVLTFAPPGLLAATTSNDASCDIGVVPAATLLLPYFEVDLDDPGGETTVFTITNVTNVDRIARVTLWTDYAFPVVTFNVLLTGYGMQSISLRDVIEHGRIADRSSIPRGPYSKPNPTSACPAAPASLPAEYVAFMRSAFVEGVVPVSGGCDNIGAEHVNAVGYATVDVVSNCSTNNPFAEEYWTEDLAYDNVLIGDYQQIDSANAFAQGSPMVHIRAIPEGGTPAERFTYHSSGGFHFTRTFYGRHQPWYDPVLDSRQPLPSVFVARWISGNSQFRTFFKIWREGRTANTAECEHLDDNFMRAVEVTVFDESENAVGEVPTPRIGNPIPHYAYLAATSMTSPFDTTIYPRLTNGASSGWMYLNLDDFPLDTRARSNWVVSSMRAEGRYSLDFDAPALGNGCSAPAPLSEIYTGNATIGPRP